MQDVINFDLLKEYDTTLKDILEIWTKQKAYSVDDTIQYRGKYLKCTIAGTSGTTTLNFTGLDVGDTINDGTVVWEIVDLPSGGVDLPEWKVNTSYTAGKYLVHEGTVYKVTTNFTSGTTFKDTNLTPYIAPKPADTVLWSGQVSDITGGATITLLDDYTKYDEIMLVIEGAIVLVLMTGISNKISYSSQFPSLGASFSIELSSTFSGNTWNIVYFKRGADVASNNILVVGRKK